MNWTCDWNNIGLTNTSPPKAPCKPDHAFCSPDQ